MNWQHSGVIIVGSDCWDFPFLLVFSPLVGSVFLRRFLLRRPRCTELTIGFSQRSVGFSGFTVSRTDWTECVSNTVSRVFITRQDGASHFVRIDPKSHIFGPVDVDQSPVRIYIWIWSRNREWTIENEKRKLKTLIEFQDYDHSTWDQCSDLTQLSKFFF